MSERPKKRIAPVYLLRKSAAQNGSEAAVLAKKDFPLRFRYRDREYETLLTRKGGVVTRRI